MADKFERFTERARKVFMLAQEEAHRFNHHYVGTEHLLLGLVREGDGIAARVLVNLGVNLSALRSAVEFIIGRGESMNVREIGLTPRAKRSLELAVDEARRLNHHYIGTEHLLLGLLREGEGMAAGILESMGVKQAQARAQVLLLIDRGQSSAEASTATQFPAIKRSSQRLPAAPKTDSLGELKQVIAVFQSEIEDRVRLTIISLEIYERGIIVQCRLTSEGGDLLLPENQQYWEPRNFEAEDDQHGYYTFRRDLISFAGNARHFALRCPQPLNPAATELWLYSSIRTPPLKKPEHRSWLFRIALRN